MNNDVTSSNNQTWDEILTIEGINLEEVYESVGVRDVLTTLSNTVNAETSERRGIVELVGEQPVPERRAVSFSDLMGGVDAPVGQTTTLSGVTGTSQRMSLAQAMQGGNAQQTPDTGDVETYEETGDEVVVDDWDADYEDDLDDLIDAINEDTQDEPVADNNSNHETQHNRNTQRSEQGDEREPMEQNNTISLNELFARQTSLADLDNNSVVTLGDIQETRLASTYTRPDLMQLVSTTEPVVEFGEDVLVARSEDGSTVEFDKVDYETFNMNRISERNRELEIANQSQYNGNDAKIQLVKDITRELFGGVRESLYGYDKIGRTSTGAPYIKSVLAGRFTKLNDRRFRKPEEMRPMSRDVAVANKLPSVKAFIEMTITKGSAGNLTASVVDAEGEHLKYLEQKFNWLTTHGYEDYLLALYMKTQLSFEEPITTIDQLKTLDFWVD